MILAREAMTSRWLRHGLCWMAALGALYTVAGCGVEKTADTDPRLAPRTYDEYTEGLKDAVISTPSGTFAVGPTGEVAAATEGQLDQRISAVSAPAGARGGRGGQSAAGTGGQGGKGGGKGGAGGGAGTGPLGSGGAPADTGTPGFASWHFDDCSPTSHFLVDSSAMGANAQHALGASCVAGVSGLGVEIRSAADVIQVPDEPQFTVGQRVAVAAWVHPNTVTGDQPIVIKRLNNQTSFSLGVHNGNIEMSVVLTTGKTFISRAPISAGVWTHVAGMYDGTFVFLFINGQQFGQLFAGGTIRNVFAPLRIGATTQTQRFDGIIDEVFVSTQDISKDVITALACISRPSTFVATPLAGGPVPFDTAVHYDVAVTDNDVGTCGPRFYNFFVTGSTRGITVTTVFPPQGSTATPGATLTFGLDVVGSEDAEPGTSSIPFEIFDSGSTFEVLSGEVSFELQAPSCFVAKRKELMITDPSVVDDGGRAAGAVADGPWTFGHLLREMAPSPADAPALALQLFQSWLTDQVINGFTVAARPAAQQQILDIWPRTATGDLDLDRAPFRLQAIVNRVDLRAGASSAGQGRFVFALTDSSGFFPEDFTVILEYDLPATTNQDVLDWANRWHALSSHPFPSEEYNAALEAVTRRFTDRNAAPGRTNGSALLQLRTNDFVLSSFTRWELREFELSPSTGFMHETTVKETPDLSFNQTSSLADFVNQNAAAIKAVLPGAPSQTVPATFEGANFLAGSVFNDFFFTWSAPGIQDSEARFHMALNTCNGCHSAETGTGFLMISPRFPGQEATLSPFLTGTTVFDPITGQPRTLNDLARRQASLTSLVCPPAAANATTPR